MFEPFILQSLTEAGSSSTTDLLEYAFTNIVVIRNRNATGIVCVSCFLSIFCLKLPSEDLKYIRHKLRGLHLSQSQRDCKCDSHDKQPCLL